MKSVFVETSSALTFLSVNFSLFTNGMILPPGLLAPDFPQSIGTVYIAACGLNDLPPSLATIWPKSINMIFVHSAATSLPPVFLRMELMRLTLQYTRISQLSPELFEISSLKRLEVNYNPLLSELPAQVASPSAILKKVNFEYTNVSALPEWMTTARFRSQVAVQGGNTPFCKAVPNKRTQGRDEATHAPPQDERRPHSAARPLPSDTTDDHHYLLPCYMVSLPDVNEFSDGGITSAIIMCGALIILIALLGCCGAQWDSKVFLFPYAILVIVSVIAQLSLAGFMYHVHNSLVTVSEHNFDLSVLSSGDQAILKWINRRFKDAYNHCGLEVDVNLTLQNHALTATCENPDFVWFAKFIETNCRIGTADLTPGSDFLKCAGANFSLTDSITQHSMLCACESRMITWVNNQSLLIAVFVFAIVFFEIALVVLSCYVMFSRRGRRHGYQEIRMPVKQQGPFNPHPRNYYGQDQSRQPINAAPQQSYASANPPYPYAAPPAQERGEGRPILGPSI
ncbi:Membrane protein, partial [Globisporangium splendens]